MGVQEEGMGMEEEFVKSLMYVVLDQMCFTTFGLDPENVDLKIRSLKCII